MRRSWTGWLPPFGSVVVLVGVLASASGVSAQEQPDLLALHQQSLDAQMGGDVDGMLGLLTDDALVQGTGLCAATPCVGKEAIRPEIERRIANQDRLTRIGAQVSGNMATVTLEVRGNSIRAAGQERIISISFVEFRGDKIASTKTQLNLNDPKTAAYLQAQTGAASAPAQAPRLLPRTGQASLPPLAMTVVISGCCLVVGLVLVRRSRRLPPT